MSSALPTPILQLSNSESLTNTTDVASLLQQSFMQFWCYDGLYVDNLTGQAARICDHAIQFRDTLILIVGKTISVTHESGHTKRKIKDSQKEQLIDAHRQLLWAADSVADSRLSIYTDSAGNNLLQRTTNQRVYLVCVTDIRITSGDKTLSYTHHYGSDYLANVCQLDYSQQVSQIFSLSDFTTIVDTLSNLSDFVNFLNNHKAYITSGSNFASDLEILHDFIETGEFLVNARAIETKLMRAGMREGMDPKLVVSRPQEQNAQFVTMRKNAQFWDNLVQMYAQQIPAEHLQQKQSSYRMLLSALMDESIYSRNNLVKTIASFPQSNETDKQEGYIVHQRSYADMNRHYVMLFYADDSTHPNHRDTAQHRLDNLASAVNFHVQDPHLEEIIVIGIAHEGTQFGVDMYYMLGQELDETTREQMLAQTQSSSQQAESQQVPSTLNGSPSETPPGNTISKSHVQSIDEKNTAAKRYDDVKQASNPRRTKPKPHKQHIKRLKINQGQAKVSQTGSTSSRNALCPCGSGKKFRHCHGAEINYSA